ncbi:hypothetical protein GA0070613_3722 [Micromonospora inositola]|uniref:Uncharacterized protein n=1 Tax=Micromonospora inositola TaxID=47865 RepID=A0A1C5IZ92_9ACTN|nr:hypothetical protein GA0070613_3722 [Micromonospora inositola]
MSVDAVSKLKDERPYPGHPGEGTVDLAFTAAKRERRSMSLGQTR